MNTFSIGEAVRVGWQKTKQNFWLLAGMILTTGAASFVFGSIQDALSGEPLAWIAAFVNFVVQLGLELGMMAVALRLIDHQLIAYKDLFSRYGQLGNFFVASFVGGLATVAGLIVFIVPGIYIALRFSQAGYIIVDRKLKGIEALKASWQLTRGTTLQLFFFFLTLIVLNTLGTLLLLIGLLVTLPVTQVATAHVYRRLVTGNVAQ
ncbi:MAG TPA: hypothetical protein VJC05_02410 [Candidatus Andersenbacteria bacterium]|nr:hypothetical protein [Candidatus Andersenbacteria bacterium]